jgi:RimJ/RimL family protein N-acetyltransferase
LNIPYPYPDGAAAAWIESHGPGYESGRRVTLAITLAEALIGAISLGLEPAHRRAELGYWIGRESWGHGYATEAVKAFLTFGFDQLGLNRIQACHYTRNPASGRVMEKAGMQFEGVQRQHVWKDGQPEDLARYAILRSDRR